jgi:hypothetical protein
MVMVVPVRFVTWRFHRVSTDAAAAVAVSVMVRSERIRIVARFFCFVYYPQIIMTRVTLINLLKLCRAFKKFDNNSKKHPKLKDKHTFQPFKATSAAP